jgi:hypothetical protein
VGDTSGINCVSCRGCLSYCVGHQKTVANEIHYIRTVPFTIDVHRMDRVFDFNFQRFALAGAGIHAAILLSLAGANRFMHVSNATYHPNSSASSPMTGENAIPWFLFAAAFWLGFSLSFYSTFFVPVAVHTGRNKDTDTSMRMPWWRRLIVTIPAFIGVGGTCPLIGFLYQTPHTEAGVLVADRRREIRAVLHEQHSH